MVLLISQVAQAQDLPLVDVTEAVSTHIPAETGQAQPLRRGNMLHIGDRVQVPEVPGHVVRLRWHNGDSLWLGPGSALQIQEEHLHLLQGSAVLASGQGLRLGLGQTAANVYQGHLVVDAGKGVIAVEDKWPDWVQRQRTGSMQQSLMLGRADAGLRSAIDPYALHAEVLISDGMARCTVELRYRQEDPQGPREADFMMHLPPGAVVDDFALYQGWQGWQPASLLPRQRARSIWQELLAEDEDPALLEWGGDQRFRTRIFPLTRDTRLRLTWVLPLESDEDGRVAWQWQPADLLPPGAQVESWQIEVLIAQAGLDATQLQIESPDSQQVDINQASQGLQVFDRGFDTQPPARWRISLPQKEQGPLLRRLQDGSGIIMIAAGQTEQLVPEHGGELPQRLLLVFDRSAQGQSQALEHDLWQGLFPLLPEGQLLRVASASTHLQAHDADWWRADDAQARSEAWQSLKGEQALGALYFDAIRQQAAAFQADAVLFIGTGVSLLPSMQDPPETPWLALGLGRQLNQQGLSNIGPQGQATASSRRDLGLVLEQIFAALRGAPQAEAPSYPGAESWWPWHDGAGGTHWLARLPADHPDLEEASSSMGLLQRAWAHAQVLHWTHEQAEPKRRQALEQLAQEHSVLTPLHALLVLASDQDRERFAVDEVLIPPAGSLVRLRRQSALRREAMADQRLHALNRWPQLQQAAATALRLSYRRDWPYDPNTKHYRASGGFDLFGGSDLTGDSEDDSAVSSASSDNTLTSSDPDLEDRDVPIIPEPEPQHPQDAWRDIDLDLRLLLKLPRSPRLGPLHPRSLQRGAAWEPERAWQRHDWLPGLGWQAAPPPPAHLAAHLPAWGSEPIRVRLWHNAKQKGAHIELIVQEHDWLLIDKRDPQQPQWRWRLGGIAGSASSAWGSVDTWLAHPIRDGLPAIPGITLATSLPVESHYSRLAWSNADNGSIAFPHSPESPLATQAVFDPHGRCLRVISMAGTQEWQWQEQRLQRMGQHSLEWLAGDGPAIADLLAERNQGLLWMRPSFGPAPAGSVDISPWVEQLIDAARQRQLDVIPQALPDIMPHLHPQAAARLLAWQQVCHGDEHLLTWLNQEGNPLSTAGRQAWLAMLGRRSRPAREEHASPWAQRFAKQGQHTALEHFWQEYANNEDVFSRAKAMQSVFAHGLGLSQASDLRLTRWALEQDDLLVPGPAARIALGHSTLRHQLLQRLRTIPQKEGMPQVHPAQQWQVILTTLSMEEIETLLQEAPQTGPHAALALMLRPLGGPPRIFGPHRDDQWLAMQQLLLPYAPQAMAQLHNAPHQHADSTPLGYPLLPDNKNVLQQVIHHYPWNDSHTRPSLWQALGMRPQDLAFEQGFDRFLLLQGDVTVGQEQGKRSPMQALRQALSSQWSDDNPLIAWQYLAQLWLALDDGPVEIDDAALRTLAAGLSNNRAEAWHQLRQAEALVQFLGTSQESSHSSLLQLLQNPDHIHPIILVQLRTAELLRRMAQENDPQAALDWLAQWQDSDEAQHWLGLQGKLYVAQGDAESALAAWDAIPLGARRWEDQRAMLRQALGKPDDQRVWSLPDPNQRIEFDIFGIDGDQAPEPLWEPKQRTAYLLQRGDLAEALQTAGPIIADVADLPWQESTQRWLQRDITLLLRQGRFLGNMDNNLPKDLRQQIITGIEQAELAKHTHMLIRLFKHKDLDAEALYRKLQAVLAVIPEHHHFRLLPQELHWNPLLSYHSMPDPNDLDPQLFIHSATPLRLQLIHLMREDLIQACWPQWSQDLRQDPAFAQAFTQDLERASAQVLKHWRPVLQTSADAQPHHPALVTLSETVETRWRHLRQRRMLQWALRGGDNNDPAAAMLEILPVAQGISGRELHRRVPNALAWRQSPTVDRLTQAVHQAEDLKACFRAVLMQLVGQHDDGLVIAASQPIFRPIWERLWQAATPQGQQQALNIILERALNKASSDEQAALRHFNHFEAEHWSSMRQLMLQRLQSPLADEALRAWLVGLSKQAEFNHRGLAPVLSYLCYRLFLEQQDNITLNQSQLRWALRHRGAATTQIVKHMPTEDLSHQEMLLLARYQRHDDPQAAQQWLQAASHSMDQHSKIWQDNKSLAKFLRLARQLDMLPWASDWLQTHVEQWGQPVAQSNPWGGAAASDFVSRWDIHSAYEYKAHTLEQLISETVAAMDLPLALILLNHLQRWDSNNHYLAPALQHLSRYHDINALQGLSTNQYRNSIAWQLALAQAFVRTGNDDEFFTILQRIFDQYPQQKEAGWLLFGHLLSSGNAFDPKNPSWQSLLAMPGKLGQEVRSQALQQLGDREEHLQLRLMSHNWATSPDRLQASLQLLHGIRPQTPSRNLIHLITQISEWTQHLHPYDLELAKQYATFLQQNGRTRQAIQHLEQVLSHDDIEDHTATGLLLQAREQLSAFRRQWEE